MLKVCGIDYEKMPFISRLLICLLFPLIAAAICLLVAIVFVFVAVLIIPILFFVWVYIIIKLPFGKKRD